MSIIFNFNYTSSYVEQYKVTVNAIILIVKQMYENMRIMELTKSVQQHRKMEYIAAQKLVKCLRLLVLQRSNKFKQLLHMYKGRLIKKI